VGARAFVLASRAEVHVTYDSLSISEVIPASPDRIYAAWLSSAEHSAFTGDKAIVEPYVGGKHSSFDGYAVGRTIELQPGRRIVQTWRAEDFPIGSPDSRIEVTLEETVGGTMLTILHTEIPSGLGSSCRDSWLKYYLEPLKGYFVAERPKANGVRTHAPVVKAKAKAKPKAKPRQEAKAKRRAPAKKVAARASKRKTARPAKAKRAAKSVRKVKRSGATSKKPRRR
jgi:uncharacterized protein YndB with AHSA1/START domain